MTPKCWASTWSDTVTSWKVTLPRCFDCRIPLMLMDLSICPNHMMLYYCTQYRNSSASWHVWCHVTWNSVPPWPVRWRRRRSQSLPTLSSILLCQLALQWCHRCLFVLTFWSCIYREEVIVWRPSRLTLSLWARWIEEDAGRKGKLKNEVSGNVNFFIIVVEPILPSDTAVNLTGRGRC